MHSVSCSYLGQKGIYDCICPIRLAAGTVHTLIQQMMTIFEESGRGRTWNSALKLGNPAASRDVQLYLKSIQEEQARSHVVPKQAKPIFASKLLSVASYIDRQLGRTDLNVRQTYVLLRDQAMFKVQFFAGDRANDVALILAQEIGKLSDDSGFVFCHTFGKTLRGDSGKSNSFVLRRCTDKMLCPVYALELYNMEVKQMGVSLFPGYLFRQVSESGRVLDTSLSYSAIYDRLKHYLVTLGIFNEETPHSFRSGCAITMGLANPRMSKEGIKNHVGWFSDRSERYYTRSSVLHDSRVVTQGLADAAASSVSVDKIFHAHADFSNLESPF